MVSQALLAYFRRHGIQAAVKVPFRRRFDPIGSEGSSSMTGPFDFQLCEHTKDRIAYKPYGFVGYRVLLPSFIET